MRMNGEVAPEEYRTRREKMLEEKRRSEEVVSDAHHRAETWLERAERLLTFAETARKRFETGDLATKREILAALGTNLILSIRTLKIETVKPLSLFQEIAPAVQALHKRLEPPKTPKNQADWEVLYSRNANWGG
jgi:hypothetical protein